MDAETHTVGRWSCEDLRSSEEARVVVSRPQSRNTWGSQELEEARQDLPPEPSKGAWPYQCLGHLAPRTLREHVPIVLSHPVCDTLLQKPQSHSIVSDSALTGI